MSKLFKLKEWLTLEETAKYLSNSFGEEVTKADVLRLALDGQLVLSVYFIGNIVAKIGEIQNSSDDLKSIKIGDQITYSLPEYESLNGIWDLPMTGGEKFDVEFLYRKLIDEEKAPSTNFDTSHIQDYQTKRIYRLIKEVGAKTWFSPHGGLPINDLIFVCRQTALTDLIQEMSDEPKERPISTSQRRTLLTIIAALCNHSSIDPQARGASPQIANMTEKIGADITAETIKKYLDEIPDAVESRMK